MSWLRLKQIASLLDAPLRGEDVDVECVATDTRKPVEGALFIALKGDRFDAHEALEKSPDLPVSGVLVSRYLDHPAPQILVDDTRLALGRLAAAWRKQFTGTLIALTGSNGKTTVKEMLASILSLTGKGHFTQGNLNNDIGVPLTLLEIKPEHRWAVIEMGANHAGEIAYLTDLARPDIAMINNAAAAHLEGFGSLEGVAKAKGEIYSGLGSDGIAVINADDVYADYWRSLNQKRRQVTFGNEKTADYALKTLQPLTINCKGDECSIELALPGRHNAMNATAAAAVSATVGVDVDVICQGLARMQSVPGRLRQQPGVGGCLVIDDSYNANPASFEAAIDVLASYPGEQILVMGDMAELGEEKNALHRAIGEKAKQKNISKLLACGSKSAHAVKAFGESAQHFDSNTALAAALKPLLGRDSVVLVKGSRSARMDVVVDAIAAPAVSAAEGGRDAI